MTKSGQDVHFLIGEVIIAHRDMIDSPHLNALHAIRMMLHSDYPFTAADELHALHIYDYAIKILTSECDYSDEKSSATWTALDAISERRADLEKIPADPWATMGDNNA